MRPMKKRKYLVPDDKDYKWGLAVNSIGYEEVPASKATDIEHSNYYEVRKTRVINDFQLMYIIDGEGIFTSKHCQRTELKKGDIFILFPGEWHMYYPNPKTGWKAYWIWFNGKTIQDSFENKFITLDKPVYSIGTSDIITRLYNDAYSTSLQEGPYSQQRLAGIVSYILGLMLSMENEYQLSKNSRSVNIVNEGLLIISETLESDISIQDIAEKLHVSYNYFRRIFRRQTGVAPAIYQKNQKIQRAKEMLLYTQLSIKEIAFKLDFDFSYFCYTFKQETGYTPGEFRDSV